MFGPYVVQNLKALLNLHLSYDEVDSVQITILSSKPIEMSSCYPNREP